MNAISRTSFSRRVSRAITGTAAFAVAASTIAGGLLAGTAEAAQWKTSEYAGPVSAIPSSARIAVADNGHAFAVWREYSGIYYTIQVAQRAVGGSWSAPYLLNSSNGDGVTPDVAVAPNGKVVVSWRQLVDAKYQLQISRPALYGTWTLEPVSPANESASDASVGIDNAGVVYAAWRSGAGLLRKATAPVEAPADVDIVSFNDPEAVGLAVTPAGRATLVWGEASGELTKLQSRQWTTTAETANQTIDTDDLTGDIDVAVNRSGLTAASYTVKNGDQGYFVMGTWGYGNQWDNPSTLSWNGDDSFDSSVGIDGKANLAVAWRTTSGKLLVATRKPGSDWVDPVTLENEHSPYAPEVVMNEHGDAAVMYLTEQPSLELAVRPLGNLAFVPAPGLISTSLVTSNRGVALDGQGNAIVVHGVKTGDAAGRVLAKVYDMAGPVVTVTKPGKRVNATRFKVSWTVKDRFSGIDWHDMNYISAPFNGSFGPLQEFVDGAQETYATFTGAPGRTYCFIGKSMDTAGNQNNDNPYRCTATPVDDRKPTRTGTWSKQKAKSAYLGTLMTTTRKGATLKLTNVRVEQLGLLVAKGPGYGRVAVFFNGTKLGAWSLGAAKVQARQQILVKDFGSVKTGTVVVKVISQNGKTVKIDGLHIFQGVQLAM